MTPLALHLFGAATPSGEAFRQLVAGAEPDWPLHRYSRRPQAAVATSLPADFRDPASFRPGGCHDQPAIWISFGPIWLLAPFLEQLAADHPKRLQGLRGLIACSSSSALTKRFAFNRFDRELAARLIAAEDQLLACCGHLQVPCHILRPSLIYGQVGPYRDRNLSRLLQLLRRLPLLPLPAETGLRQPIHARQLAAVALQLVRQLTGQPWESSGHGTAVQVLPQRIVLGGDITLSYSSMLRALQQALPIGDPARRCCLLSIPNRLFHLLTVPLVLRSPQAYEAVLRIGADLAGFMPVHQLLLEPIQPFPLLPLD